MKHIEQLYACPKCRYFFATVALTSDRCKDCGTKFVPVPIPYIQYTAMSQEEREKAKADFFDAYQAEKNQKTTPPYTGEPAQKVVVANEVVIGNEVLVSMGPGEQLPKYPGWWLLLDMACNFLVGIFIFLGICVALFAENLGAGIIAGVIIALVGCLLVATTKVFLEIAVDIREIRNKLNT